jgi:hypothetical protein
MKHLSEIALEAFKYGSDNFGEKPTGEVGQLIHEPFSPTAMYFGTPNPKTHKYYHCTVFLVQPDGHPCTSDIGFYVKDNIMGVFSGDFVFTVPVTDEIQKELDEAYVVSLDGKGE